jgi:hypothetical protein
VKPQNLDQKPSMKKVATMNSATETLITTRRAVPSGMMPSRCTPTAADRQFLSFARAVAVSVMIRYAVMAARTNCTWLTLLNSPRMVWVHFDLYRVCGVIESCRVLKAETLDLFWSILQPETYYDASIEIDSSEMLE